MSPEGTSRTARPFIQGRIGLLLTAMAAMAAGLWGGLARLGLPLAGPDLVAVHGPLMVCGVFGTLISLERAAALNQAWAYAAPVLFAAGFAALLAGAPGPAPLLLFTGGALAFTATSAAIFVLQPALFTSALCVGAAALLVGNTLWLAGSFIPEIVAWWIAFFVATIAGERLELSRALRTGRWARAFFVLALVPLCAGAALGLGTLWGQRLLGIALLAMATWLFRNDVARRTVRTAGITRYFAAAMLLGYVWMAIAGLIALVGSGIALQYDLLLHAIFLGFVLSMVMAHALIIFPALTGIALSYHRLLYLPLALLHVSVALRVAGGILGADDLRLLSGPLTAASLLLFGGVLALVRRRPASALHRVQPSRLR